MKHRILGVLVVLFACLSLPTWAQTVNINTASAAEIAETLQGVGEAKAEAIVAFREGNGNFESVESLAEVRGIGAATVEKNRERITLE